MEAKWVVIAGVGAFLLSTAAILLLTLPMLAEIQKERVNATKSAETTAAAQPPKLQIFQGEVFNLENVEIEGNKTMEEKANGTKVLSHMMEMANRTFERFRNKTIAGIHKAIEGVEGRLTKKMEKEATTTTTTQRPLDESLKYQVGGASLVAVPVASLVTIGKVPLIPITLATHLTTTTTTTKTTTAKIGGEIEPLTSSTPKSIIAIASPVKSSVGAANELPSLQLGHLKRRSSRREIEKREEALSA